VQRLLVDVKDKMLSFLFQHAAASVFANTGCPLAQVGYERNVYSFSVKQIIKYVSWSLAVYHFFEIS